MGPSPSAASALAYMMGIAVSGTTTEEFEAIVVDWLASALHFLNDKSGKPVSIERFIGRRPIFAAGNSDGDYEMLEWTTQIGKNGGP
jgi:hypothetical protein